MPNEYDPAVFFLLFQEQPLEGWVVRRSNLDSPELFFQIPPSYILAGGNTLTVSTRMHLIHARTHVFGETNQASIYNVPHLQK